MDFDVFGIDKVLAVDDVSGTPWYSSVMAAFHFQRLSERRDLSAPLQNQHGSCLRRPARFLINAAGSFPS